MIDDIVYEELCFFEEEDNDSLSVLYPDRPDAVTPNEKLASWMEKIDN